MLVCDVALGNPYTVTEACPSLTTPPVEFDSLHGVKATSEQKSFFKVIAFFIQSMFLNQPRTFAILKAFDTKRFD